MKIINCLLITLIIFFSILRVIRLDYAPPSLSNDEISIAYDAFSISQTLRDEHNHFLPVSFQSHGTYKAPIAIYLSSPLTMLLGNNDYSARLPSAIFGILTIIALYLLTFQLTKNKTLALVSATVLSMTPLNIYTSRMALESNIALFFVTFGLYLLFRGIQNSSNLSVLGGTVSLVLSIYSYHTEWGFVPVFVFLIFIFYRQKIWKEPIYYISAVLFLVLVSPVIYDLTQHIHENTRASTENIIKDPTVNFYLANPNINLFQKLQVIISVFFDKYSSYTNLSHIFFHGANLLPKSNPFQIGLFLWPFIIPFLVGLFGVKKYYSVDYKFVYLFLITGPIIPSLTIGDVNNIRNLIITIPISMICGVGILSLINYFRKNKKVFTTFLSLSVLLIFISVFYFLAIYFYFFPTVSGVNYQYGYREIAQILKTEYPNYQKIIIDPRFGTKDYYFSGVPHLYIPYYTSLDPRKLQQRKQSTFINSFDKYEIRDIHWQNEKPLKNYLYVVPADQLPIASDFQKIHQIDYPDMTPAFFLYTVR